MPGLPEGPDVAHLVDGPFVGEQIEWHEKRVPAIPVAVPASAPAPAPGPVPLKSHVTRVEEVPHVPLLERIDARLLEKIVIDENTATVPREQYRRLAAVLHEAQGARGVNSLLIASAVAGEGKTLTAVNLALTFSESYRRRVLLVDADLRRPKLHALFGVTAQLTQKSGWLNSSGDLPVDQVSPTLSILSGAEPTDDPMAALTSKRMTHVLAEAKRAFDWIIVDTPPLVALPDAHLLASMVDGVVLVVRANSTPHSLIARATEAVGRSRIFGVVLNDAASPAPASEPYASVPSTLRP
jgi:capsular exopolysaccharide synthesis family protein